MPGKLKFTTNEIIFKQAKTGHVENISADHIDLLNWQRIAGRWGLRVFTKDGILNRFGPFREQVQHQATRHKINDVAELLEKQVFTLVFLLLFSRPGRS
jgi:structure-specific recognition protein 1